MTPIVSGHPPFSIEIDHFLESNFKSIEENLDRYLGGSHKFYKIPTDK